MLVDIHRGQLNPAAMTNLTPEIALPLHYGYPTPEKGYFKEPYPLSDKLFLVSYNFGPDHASPAGYGLYVLDITGHRELMYRAPRHLLLATHPAARAACSTHRAVGPD